MFGTINCLQISFQPSFSMVVNALAVFPSPLFLRVRNLPFRCFPNWSSGLLFCLFLSSSNFSSQDSRLVMTLSSSSLLTEGSGAVCTVPGTF